MKELTVLFQHEICPSIQAHHIIQLSVRFWKQHIQITCYHIQRRGGTERVHCRAPFQSRGPMSAGCTSITITSNELNPVSFLLSSRRHKPRAHTNFTLGIVWAPMTRTPLMKHSALLFPACGFTVKAGQHLCSRNKFLEQTNLHKIKKRDKKTGGQETYLTCFSCYVMRRNQKIALAPVVQKQCMFGRTW